MKITLAIIGFVLTAGSVTFSQLESEGCKCINNKFANSPFAIGIVTLGNIDSIGGGPFSLTKSPIKNQFGSRVDTLYRLQSSKSEIILYVGEMSSYVITATITDSLTLFIDGINIGDNKATVLKKLRVIDKSRCDIVQVTDEENFSHHRLYFESGALKKITLNFGMN